VTRLGRAPTSAGDYAAIEQPDDSVVVGAKNASTRISALLRPPANRSSKAAARSASLTGGINRARAARQNKRRTKGPEKNQRHLPAVRPGTSAARVVTHRAHTSKITAAAYTRRPKNRTDGGVLRRRHPSRAQQKLYRRSNR